MEKENEDSNAASFTWWQDSHNRPPQSPWLQATLSDLDEKTKVMLSVIDQDDGDSFERRAEMYYSRRPELLETIKELHKSYCSLAQRYHQLTALYPMVYSLNSFKHQNCDDVGNSHPGSLSPVNTLAHDNVKPSGGATPTSKSQESQGEAGAGAEAEAEAEAEKKLQVTASDDNTSVLLKLMEDSLYQQAELTRTNNDNREAIQHFRTRVNTLVDDNTALKTFLATHRPPQLILSSN